MVIGKNTEGKSERATEPDTPYAVEVNGISRTPVLRRGRIQLVYYELTLCMDIQQPSKYGEFRNFPIPVLHDAQQLGTKEMTTITR
jgi:hypothetical protein